MRFIIIKLFSLQWTLLVSSQRCRRQLKLPSVGNLQIVRHRDHFKAACDFQSSAEWPVGWRSLTVGGQLGSHLVVLRQPFKRLHNCRGNCTLGSTWIQVETTDWKRPTEQSGQMMLRHLPGASSRSSRRFANPLKIRKILQNLCTDLLNQQ